jgi:hypothetical protein
VLAADALPDASGNGTGDENTAALPVSGEGGKS